MLIALLCESEMKLADETIEIILDKVSYLKISGLLLVLVFSFYLFIYFNFPVVFMNF